MKKTIPIVFCVIPILWLLSPGAAQKIKNVDGVTVISNGKIPTPPKGRSGQITLTEELTIGQGENPDEAFSEVAAFVVDKDGNIYAVDVKDKKIKAYDRNGKFLRPIGKPGQGPGEINLPSGIQLTADNLLMVEDAMNRRLAFFKPTGEFVKNISTADKLGLMRVFLDAKGGVLAMEIGLEGTTKMFFEIKKYSPDLKPLFSLDKIEFPVALPGSGVKLNPMEMLSFYQLDPQGNILYGRNAVYEIKIYSPEGKHIRTIQKEYNPTKITKQDIDEMIKQVASMPGGASFKDMYAFPENFPPFQSFLLDDKGQLFVRTYTRGKVKGEYAYDVFDTDGRFIAQFFTKSDLRRIQNGKGFGIEETEDGFRVIKRYAVSWQ